MDTFSATPRGNGLSPILKTDLIVPCRRMRPSVSIFLLLWRPPRYRLWDDFDQVFEIAPILQRERENRLYGFTFRLGN